MWLWVGGWLVSGRVNLWCVSGYLCRWKGRQVGKQEGRLLGVSVVLRYLSYYVSTIITMKP